VQKLFTYLLLLTFTVAIIPVEWLHECTHQHSEVEHTTSEECDICEFDFAWFITPAETPSSRVDMLLGDQQCPLVDMVCVAERANGAARAPPAVLS